MLEIHFIFQIFISSVICLTIIVILRLWLHRTKGRCDCKTKLGGKVAIVTGGTSGIGLETARELARKGAKVIVASIDDTYIEVVEDIINSSGNTEVHYMYMDLSKFASIRQFVHNFTSKFDRLDILVNNAGCNGLRHKLSEDGIEMVMQINYLGPFLLTNLLMQRYKSTLKRIVNVSSYAHHFANMDIKDLAHKEPAHFYRKYANSKLCIILWTKALSKKLPEGTTANVVHPGLSKTNMFRRMNSFIRFFFLIIINILFKTAEEGAQTSIHVCVAPELENISGGYFSDCKLRQLKIRTEDEIVDALWENSVLLSKSNLPACN